nr:transcription factor MYB1R1 [Quercus suber]POE48241.1 transcription factor myb1r1 [Quercus suber]
MEMKSETCGNGEIILFGVRVVVDSMRKSVSMNNLSQYEQPQPQPQQPHQDGEASNNSSNKIQSKDDVAAGYASADDAAPSSRATRERERKRGVPWTEDEHKLFLLGLQKVGKGDWRGISRNFVKTRTPTQVASHAQKYFLRRTNLNRRRRRSSLFDITTDTVTAIPMEEEPGYNNQDNVSNSHSLPPPPPEKCNFNGYPMMPAFPMTVGPAVVPVPIENPMENLSLGHGNLDINASSKLVRPIPIHTATHAATITDLNLNWKLANDPSPLTLKLSLTSDQRESPSRHPSAFQAMPNFNNGDSIITVA